MPRIDPTALERMFLPESLRPQEVSIVLTRNKLPDNILTRRERFEKAPIDKMLREASFPPKRWTPSELDKGTL
jgi:hypothetical protein